jgi:hypothetical protein
VAWGKARSSKGLCTVSRLLLYLLDWHGPCGTKPPQSVQSDVLGCPLTHALTQPAAASYVGNNCAEIAKAASDVYANYAGPLTEHVCTSWACTTSSSSRQQDGQTACIRSWAVSGGGGCNGGDQHSVNERRLARVEWLVTPPVVIAALIPSMMVTGPTCDY